MAEATGVPRRALRCLRSAGVRAVVVALLLGGALGPSRSAAADGDGDAADRDPFIALNRPVHRFNEGLDARLVEPAARAWRRAVPDPVERAVVNFFLNLYGPLSITGALLQADPQRTVVATSRFAVNSTLGVGGLFDPATPMGLPDTQEDIGQALEVWGFEDSPYLVLPLIGPLTLVQVPDRMFTAWGPPWMLGDYWSPGLRVLDIVSFRADSLAATSLLQESAVDTYTFTREAYLQRRRYLRYNGDPPVEDWSDFLDDF